MSSTRSKMAGRSADQASAADSAGKVGAGSIGKAGAMTPAAGAVRVMTNGVAATPGAATDAELENQGMIPFIQREAQMMIRQA